jgi:hypothetical protein
VALLLHKLCAPLVLQELPVLLEVERSALGLAVPWVEFPVDVVQVQLLLHPMALWLKLELVQLPWRLRQRRHAGRGGATGATGCLGPQLGALPLRVLEFLGALERLQGFALLAGVDLCLLGRVRLRFAELGGGYPAGGRAPEATWTAADEQ